MQRLKIRAPTCRVQSKKRHKQITPRRLGEGCIRWKGVQASSCGLPRRACGHNCNAGLLALGVAMQRKQEDAS